jgi:hypothetical protein
LSPGSSCFAAKITIAQARQELLHTLKVPEMVSPLWCHNKGFPDWLHYEGITLRSLPLQSKTTWLTCTGDFSAHSIQVLQSVFWEKLFKVDMGRNFWCCQRTPNSGLNFW